MEKYRIWTNGKKYKIQRKRFFGWEWLDSTSSWCNWYGKERPKIFDKKEIDEFIDKPKWKTSQEIELD